MGRRASCVDDIANCAEMITVVVETHAGRRLSLGPQRNQKLELERLLDLTDCHHLAYAAKEWIAGSFDFKGQTEGARDGLRSLNPAPAKIQCIVRAADADVLPHPE